MATVAVAASILSNWYISLKLELVPCYIPEVSTNGKISATCTFFCLFVGLIEV